MADTAKVELDNTDYAVILKEVLPFPTLTNQELPKKAVIEIISW